MDPSALLNADQARHLLSVLRHADETVGTIERVLTGEDASTLHPIALDMSAAEARQIHEQLAALVDIIARTAEQFSLHANSNDGRSVIRSRLSILWAGLEDARSATLGRYGDVHPDLESALNPLIGDMIARTLAIIAIVDEHR